MKHIFLATICLSLFATTGANAASISLINGAQGAKVCKQEIRTYASQAELHFQRESAASFRGSSFTYWINASSKFGEQRGPMRYRCEISRSGEVLELIEEGGRWNI